MDEYIKSDTRILTFISDGANQYLLYFPNTDSKAATKLFYIISVLEITDILKENQIDGITSIALIDPDGNPVLGSNLANLTAVSDKFTAEPGIYKVNKENALCMHSGIRGGYAIAALFSNGPVVKQINDVFHSTYIILFGMGILGMLLAFLCMHTTYSPLRKLTKRIVADPNSKEEYIAQLDKAFNSTISENELLQTRLDKYRLSMQSSILDSIFTDGKQNKQNHLNNIDQFFTADPNTCIFVLRIGSKEHSIPAASITQFLENRLPGKDTCVTLESGEHHVTYMVNYTGTEPHKEAVICQLMTDLHKETDYLCAISASTSSPLEIPALYENAVMASNFWDKKAVVSYHEIVNVSSHGHSPQFAYPYERLEWLTASLKDLDFPTAHQQIADLLDSITLLANRQSQFPDFFIRCILIDILMCLINSMNQMNINFSDYSDLYYETLYYCRSCSYQEKETAIHENLNRLLEIFQSQLHSASIHKAQILKIMEANYVSPDFCIAMMADQFHVSIAYMSYLFKKKINENFIDYLWNLRLQKA